jgi:hypothetical protein
MPKGENTKHYTRQEAGEEASADLKEQKKEAEDMEKGYRVKNGRKLTNSVIEDLKKKPRKQAEKVIKKEKETEWKEVSGGSGGMILEEKVEPTLSEINQEKINKEDKKEPFDYYRDPKEANKKREQTEIDETAENEMGDRIRMNEEKEKEEISKEIERLEKEVEIKRNKYTSAEYRATNVVSRIKKILPFVKTNSGDVAEVSAMHEEYKNSLNVLLNQKLEKLKSSGFNGEALKKEMGNLVNYFKVEEKNKLFETYTNSRAEAMGDKTKKIMAASSRFINWHRKLDWKTKAVAGAALGITGLSLFGRIVGAASAGVGAKEYLEGRYRKKEAKEEEKEKEKILKEMEPDEQNFEKLYSFLEKDINASAEKLKKEKREALKRTQIGIGVGLIIGSGALSGLTQRGFNFIKSEHFGASVENLSGAKPKMSGILPGEHSGSKLGSIQPKVDHIKPPSIFPDTPSAGETISGIGKLLEIKSGSSLWQTLQDNGLDKKQISSMIKNYAKGNGLDLKSLDEMYPGEKIVLSPDGKSIAKILESLDSHLMKSVTEISGGNNSVWREIKGLGFGDIEKPELTKSLAKVMEKYQEILGDSANLNSGEKIQNWVARMAKLAMEKQK